MSLLIGGYRDVYISYFVFRDVYILYDTRCLSVWISGLLSDYTTRGHHQGIITKIPEMALAVPGYRDGHSVFSEQFVAGSFAHC